MDQHCLESIPSVLESPPGLPVRATTHTGEESPLSHTNTHSHIPKAAEDSSLLLPSGRDLSPGLIPERGSYPESGGNLGRPPAKIAVPIDTWQMAAVPKVHVPPGDAFCLPSIATPESIGDSGCLYSLHRKVRPTSLDGCN